MTMRLLLIRSKNILHVILILLFLCLNLTFVLRYLRLLSSMTAFCRNEMSVIDIISVSFTTIPASFFCATLKLGHVCCALENSGLARLNHCLAATTRVSLASNLIKRHQTLSNQEGLRITFGLTVVLRCSCSCFQSYHDYTSISKCLCPL